MRTHTMFGLAAAMLPITAMGAADLKITEIYEGVSGDDITEDWLEITNFGNMPFELGVDGDLFFDDGSADPTEDEMVTGISSIGVGESVVVVLGNAQTDADDFVNAWGAANLSGVQVGFLAGDDPGGLSQGGEDVFLFDGNTAGANVVDSVFYLGTDQGGTAGSTWVWDPIAGTFPGDLSAQDGVFGAFTAPTAAGDFGEFPLIGSPGAIPAPGAASLLGLGGLAAMRRRRRA